MFRPHRFAPATTLLTLAALHCGFVTANAAIDLQPVLEWNLGTPVGQCRAVPVDLGDKRGLFLAWCEDAEIDPYVEMFFFPRHPRAIMPLNKHLGWNCDKLVGGPSYGPDRRGEIEMSGMAARVRRPKDI
jgi:hypothetical protein